MRKLIENQPLRTTQHICCTKKIKKQAHNVKTCQTNDQTKLISGTFFVYT